MKRKSPNVLYVGDVPPPHLAAVEMLRYGRWPTQPGRDWIARVNCVHPGIDFTWSRGVLA